MARTVCKWVAAALVTVFATSWGYAQTATDRTILYAPTSYPMPVPQAPTAPVLGGPTLSAPMPQVLPNTAPVQPTQPIPPTPPAAPPPGSLAATYGAMPCTQPACAYQDRNGPLLKCDPLLEDLEHAPPGWFGAVELDIVDPHIRNGLTSTANTSAGTTNTIHLPTAPLAWVASPRFELGYRPGQADYEFLVAFRFLTSSGTEVLPSFDAAGNAANLHSRLTMNMLDLDFAGREFSLGAMWDMKWRVGARVGSTFFDSQASSPMLDQRTLNNFVGVGPHVGLDLNRRIGTSGLALFSRVESALVIGEIHQDYTEVILPPGGGRITGMGTQAQLQPVPTLDVHFGACYTPPWNPALQFSTGYMLERWFNVGETAFATKGDVMFQGAFLRLAYRY